MASETSTWVRAGEGARILELNGSTFRRKVGALGVRIRDVPGVRDRFYRAEDLYRVKAEWEAKEAAAAEQAQRESRPRERRGRPRKNTSAVTSL